MTNVTIEMMRVEVLARVMTMDVDITMSLVLEQLHMYSCKRAYIQDQMIIMQSDEIMTIFMRVTKSQIKQSSD